MSEGRGVMEEGRGVRVAGGGGEVGGGGGKASLHGAARPVADVAAGTCHRLTHCRRCHNQLLCDIVPRPAASAG